MTFRNKPLWQLTVGELLYILTGTLFAELWTMSAMDTQAIREHPGDYSPTSGK